MKTFLRYTLVTAIALALNLAVTLPVTAAASSPCSKHVRDSQAPVSMCAAQNFPPKNMNAYMPVKSLLSKEGPVGVGMLSTRWKNGSNLKVGFMDDEFGLKDKVMNVARQWSKYANLTFSESSVADADIRVSFKGEGYWSVLGKQAKTVPKKEQTMNLEFSKNESATEIQRVTLHEFGHAIGLLHEHESPLSKIPWDKNAVYKYYTGPPNCWTRQDVNEQVLQREKPGPDIALTTFDKYSIMCYPVSDRLTVGQFRIGWNTKLSATDKKFVAKLYPKG